jgi:hypothetical protein
MPQGNNRAANKTFNDARKAAVRALGKKIDEKTEHDRIAGQESTYRDIYERLLREFG